MIFHLALHVHILAYLCIPFGFTNCNKNTPEDIVAIKLTVQYPIIREGEVFYRPDTVLVFYLNNYVLYKIAHTESYSMNGELIREERVYDSFIFESGNKFGFFFPSGKDSTKPGKLPVDSFLFVRAYHSGFPFDFSKLTLVEKEKRKQKLTETYVGKSGVNTFDSTILSFDKSYKKIPYSFNSQLDSTRESKLVKISMILAESFSERYNMKFPKREFIFEIKRLVVSEPQVIERFIQKLVARISEG